MNESNEVSKDSEDDWGVVDSKILPYQDEPLAAEEEALDFDDSERDVDGLTPSTLAERYERTVCLESWCRCQHCRTELLVGSIEFRCCREVTSTSGKMVFDGSIEKISCITQHEDCDAITNEQFLFKWHLY
ncbi:unnamed protein product [Porites lobata]|uniref:Uncharacterized protein n=1 Tax=Porites lobata TaxID=104759 RepID=A0ABN8R0N4_9CNID|nr:unnamed protein product [Porites lobata]